MRPGLLLIAAGVFILLFVARRQARLAARRDRDPLHRPPERRGHRRSNRRRDDSGAGDPGSPFESSDRIGSEHNHAADHGSGEASCGGGND